MSLSRWNHSPWYIYDTDSDQIQVSFFGNFSSEDILNNYNKINQQAKDEGYGILARLELYFYLKLWAKAQRHPMGWTAEYDKALELLRSYGYCKNYLRSPWESDFPRILQCEHSLGPIDDKFWERYMRITERAK